MFSELTAATFSSLQILVSVSKPNEQQYPTDLRLILEIFTNLASCEVPDLNETVNRASDKVLTIGREPCTFHVSLLTKLHHKTNITMHDEYERLFTVKQTSCNLALITITADTLK